MASQLLTLAVLVGLVAFAFAGAPWPVLNVVHPPNPLNDPDLPGYVHTNLNMAAGSIVIPFGTLQGWFNGTTHIYNLPVYGLVAHLLWKDIPLHFALLSGKTRTNQTDFTATTVKLWPRTPAADVTTPVARDFDGGAWIVPANYARFAWVYIYDYVNGSARAERAADCETNVTVIFNSTAPFTIPLRYNYTSKPFIAVMDSSSNAVLQIKFLKWGGFVYGQHYKQMNYAEANSISESTCVSYISEPHFAPSSTDALTFQSGMRTFVESGGNFIAECGGIGTYEQCNNDYGSPVALDKCPNGFLVTSPGGFRFNQGSESVGAGTEQPLAPDTLFGQYIGSYQWMPGLIKNLALWNTLDGASSNTTLNVDNAGHWVSGGINTDAYGGRTYDAVHSKLKKFHGKAGGNVFYLSSHEYLPADGLSSKNEFRKASPAGIRMWLNGALHIANRTGCKATVTLPDGTVRTVGELTIDPCRYVTDAPECNTVYNCSAPVYSGYYKEGWNYGVELIKAYPLNFTFNVTLPNRIAILTILDAYNFTRSGTTSSAVVNILTSVHKTLPYYYDLLPKWNKVWVAETYTTQSTGVPAYYSRLTGFTSNRDTFASFNAPANQGTGTSRILDALLAGVQDQILVWDGAMRVVHVYTNSTPGIVPSGLAAALNVLRTPVVIVVPTTALKASYDALNLPRTTVVATTFPNLATPASASEASIGTAANAFLPPILTATANHFATIPLTFNAATDSIGVSNGASVVSAVPEFSVQTNSLISLNAPASQQLALALPGQYGNPGGPTYSPFPYTITWNVGGVDYTFKTAIFWSEYAAALPFTATVNENTNVTVPIVGRLRLASTATSTKDIFIEVLNITKDGGSVDVWATDFDLVANENDDIMVKGTYYRADNVTFRTKFNKFGTYVVNYRVYDRCVRSESTITLTVLDVNTPPTGTSFTSYLKPGEAVNISWTLPLDKLDDVETPKDQLRVSFDTVSIPNSGSLQVLVNGVWTNAVASTLYLATVPVRFLSTASSTVNATFPYSVWDAGNAKNIAPVSASFQFLEPPNQPPVIAVDPSTNPTLTTVQGTKATFTVTVTDFLFHVTSKVRIESVSVAWADLVTLRPSTTVDPRSYSLFNGILAGDVLLDSIPLTVGANNNTASFTFEWTPSANAPFGATYTFVIFAEDPYGLISNKATVVLKTPVNIAPVVVGFESPSATPSFSEVNVSTSRALTIAATDANEFHTNKLNYTILSLPVLGTLYYSDCTTAVKINDVVTYDTQVQPSNRTVQPFCYVQNPYSFGTDTIAVRATDLAGLQSPVKILNIDISPVNWPPVSVNITRATNGDPVTFTIDSSDPDGDELTFTIISVNVDSAFGTLVYNLTGTAIAPGQTFTPSQTTLMGWAQKFTYTPNPLVVAHSANFSYRVTDPDGLNSAVYWAVVSLVTDYVPPVPPVSIPANLTIPEDNTLKINFDTLVSDPDSVPVQIVIETVPANGTLYGPGNTVLTPGSIVTVSQNGSFLIDFVPTRDYFGTTNFTYRVVDSQGLTSNTSVITIEVTPVNDPPLIKAAPVDITVARSETGSFIVNVSDIDSASIQLVVAAGNTIPADSTLTSNTWTLSGTAQSTIATLINTAKGEDIVTKIDWAPLLSLVDGSTGSFTVYAVDSDGADSVSRPVLTVHVVPNNPPTIVPTYNYNFTVNEDFGNLDITLAGTDLDVYHREVLDVILLSLPETLALKQSDANVALGTITSTGANNQTSSLVTLVSQDNFHGTVTFTFQVRDLLGAVSSIQTVTINVVSVNDPPISKDATLVVNENLCFSSAANCPVLTDITTLIPVTLTAADVDLDPLSLTFNTLPVNGTLYTYDGSSLIPVTAESRFDPVNGNNWQFYYEPLAGVNSNCVDIKNPSESTCDVLTTANFVISDGTTTTSQTLSLIVLPVNVAPTGQDLVFTVNEDENLTITLPATDVDDAPSALVVSTTGIASGSRGSLKTSSGVDVPSTGVQNTDADKKVVFVPVADDFSGADKPYTRFFYKVTDAAGATSAEYSVTIYVLPVADELIVLGDNFIRIDEDTTGTFLLGQQGINWMSKDKGEFTLVLVSATPKGVFSYCLSDDCENIPSDTTSNTVVGADTQVTYAPPPNEFGENFAVLTYKLILRPEGISTATVVTTTFTVHVNPVNDPPVLVPLFPIDPLATVFDEDTTYVIYFNATDIDTPDDQLSASLVHGLDSNLPMKVYSCETVDDETNACINGTLLSSESFKLVNVVPAHWALGLHPAANVNGKTRFTFIVNDGFLDSVPVIAPITVRPINDAPKINNATLNATEAGASFSFTASDIDFTFKTVNLTFTDLTGFGSFNLGEYQVGSTRVEGNPCYFPNSSSLTCELPILSIPSWLDLIRYTFESSSSNSSKRALAADEPSSNSTNSSATLDRPILITLDDLSNVDYRPNMNLYDSVILTVIPPVPGSLIAKTGTSDNSIAIGAALGGLALAGLIAGLVFFFARQKAADNVADYFSRMALNMEGTSNSSPLYQGAAKGGANALYQGGSIMT